MRLAVPVLASLALAACAPPPDDASAPESGSTDVAAAVADDGTYLARIDPLGGHWRVEQLDGEDFTRFNGWVDFSAGGFLNHGAGCAGGHPAFYRLDGERIAITRREPVRVGKCAGTSELADATPAERAAAGESERRLAGFLDRLQGWQRDGERLVLTTDDGRRAILTRPVEPHAQLAGRWLIETIGGERLETERRPPVLSITRGSIGGHADCNSFGGSFTVPAPGRIAVSGPMVSTLIGCAPEDAAEDALMMQAITAATAFTIAGDRLTLSGGPGLTARRPAAPDRRLAGEYEHCGNTLLGAYHAGPVTLAIDDTTMRDNAGCVADYTARGPELALRLRDDPACGSAAPPYVPGEPVEIGGAISTLAVTRPDGFGFTGEGQLVLRTGRGLLAMCRKGSPRPFGS